MKPHFTIKSKVCGILSLKAIKINPDGSRGVERILAEPFSNLILDTGMDYIGESSGDFCQRCQVGSGNTPPVVGNTQLETLVASTVNRIIVTPAFGPGPDYYGQTTFVYEFGVGAAAGNLSEVGIGQVTGDLFSRALIVDGGGNPTTITVLPDEILQVTYILRQYAPLVDVVDSVVISAILYDTVLRAAGATGSNGAGWSIVSDETRAAQFAAGGARAQAFSTNVLGAIIAYPTGTAFGTATATQAAYTNGTFFRDITYSWAIAEGNAPGGVGSVACNSSRGAYQISFDPVLAKDGTKVLNLVFRFAWVRV